MDLGRLEPTDVGSERRRILVTAAVLGTVAALAALDLSGDVWEGTSWQHALVEGLIVLVGGVGLFVVLRRLADLRRRELEAQAEMMALGRELERSRAEGARWRAEARDLLVGLGALIDQQFGRWGLTAAEREVALLLLKGFSHKEVASIREVSEATVRQQAAAVYRKAGVAGRHDLAAFFLEDLLAPRGGG
jgi:DNA-binding CsgD family transcriptional regulator